MADSKQSNKGGNPDSDVGEQGRAGDTVNPGSKFTIKFCGQVVGPGISRNATKERAISTAERHLLHQERHQTPDHVWMAFFTHASCCEKKGKPAGAYSVVFRENAPTSPDHGKLSRMAWYLISSPRQVVDDKRLALLAIAQAITIADQRLIPLLNLEKKPKKATIKVFAHCVDTLKKINDPSAITGAESDAHLEVVKLIENSSFSLTHIDGIEVRLFLHWLPTGYPQMNSARFFVWGCHSKGRNLFSVQGEKRAAALMPDSASLFIRNPREESEDSEMEELREAMSKARERPTSMEDVVMQELPVEVPRPGDGQTDLGHEVPAENEYDIDEQTTASMQVPNENDEEVSNDEQALVDQQILADCYEQHIQSVRQ